MKKSLIFIAIAVLIVVGVFICVRQFSVRECGGIAGKICPSGYECAYAGNYPDASGRCVRQSSAHKEEVKEPIPEFLVCGGIAGEICPSGYECIYTGDYPDAQGRCVEE
jgi:hypothetical protein